MVSNSPYLITTLVGRALDSAAWFRVGPGPVALFSKLPVGFVDCWGRVSEGGSEDPSSWEEQSGDD